MNNSKKIELLFDRVLLLERNLNRQTREMNSMQQTMQKILVYLPINNENYYHTEIRKMINDVLLERDDTNVENDDTNINDESTISYYESNINNDDNATISDYDGGSSSSVSDGEEHSSMHELIEILSEDEDEYDNISFSDFTPQIIELLSDDEDDEEEDAKFCEDISNFEKCENCIERENTNLKDYNIAKYVRVKLGQKYPIPDYDEYGRIKHLRIDFDAQEDITNNKKIIDLFDKDFINKKIVIYTHEGSGSAVIISKLSYDKYDYWNADFYSSFCFPCEKIIDITGDCTIGIIIKLIEYCKNVNNIKQERIKKIKNDIINVKNRKEQWEKEIDINDDADTFRSMRYSKQDSNHKMSLTQELIFIENDVNYTLGNNIITIEHPLTHTKLKRSLVNNKTFYKGKWRTDISVKLIISWYSSNYDLLDEL